MISQELIPLVKWVIGAIGLLVIYFFGREAEREKQGRIYTEKENLSLKNEKQHLLQRMERIAIRSRASDIKDEELQAKLSKVDVSKLTDDELNQLYKDPLGFLDVYADSRQMEKTTAEDIRKGRKGD